MPEKKVCAACPRQDQCPLKFKIPNAKFLAGASDVFSVLLAYGQQAQYLEKVEQRDDLDTLIDINPEMTDDQVKDLDLRRIYGLRLKDAIVVLNALAKISDSQMDQKDFFQEKFSNAISVYENEAGIDKYSTSVDERKDKGLRKMKNEVSLRPDFQGKNQLRPSDNNIQRRSEGLSRGQEGYLDQKKRQYHKKFDEKVSLTPVMDDSPQKPKKKESKSSEDYLDNIKKKASTAVNMHFLKDSKKNLESAPRKMEPSDGNERYSEFSRDNETFKPRTSRPAQYMREDSSGNLSDPFPRAQSKSVGRPPRYQKEVSEGTSNHQETPQKRSTFGRNSGQDNRDGIRSDRYTRRDGPSTSQRGKNAQR